jgi:DNA polymerase III delta prime subunit
MNTGDTNNNQNRHQQQQQQQQQQLETQHSFVIKYQPSKISSFQQMDSVFKTTLESLIAIDSLNILITGAPGVGKTSVINAVVREYYGDAYNDENILVLNSLKDQGIQYYRSDLKVFSQTNSLVKNKKKIILLDDVDLINEQSQQVFRNCMDKYSHNVHFIMSCTNLQKVIDSLQSRHIIMHVPMPTIATMYQIANHIICEEAALAKNVTDADALAYIVALSNRSIRLLVNYIEKIYIMNVPLTLGLAKMIYTNICVNDFERYTEFIKVGDLTSAIRSMHALHDHGYSVIDIFENYFSFVKTTDILDEMQKYQIISLLCKYITVFHNVHEDEIELALFSNNAICALRTTHYALRSATTTTPKTM